MNYFKISNLKFKIPQVLAALAVAGVAFGVYSYLNSKPVQAWWDETWGYRQYE